MISLSISLAVLSLAPQSPAAFGPASEAPPTVQAAGTVPRVAALTGPGPNARFGCSVSLSRGTLAVGAETADVVGPNAGAVYLFELDKGGWNLIDQLLPPAPGSQYFGETVALDGDMLAVSWRDSSYSNGSVNVYGRTAAGWTLEATAGPFEFNQFGDLLDLSGDTLAVGFTGGCLKFYCNPAEYVSIRERDAGGPNAWQEVASVYGPNSGFYGCYNFANSVHLDGDTLIASEPGIGSLCGGTRATYVYDRNTAPTSWSIQQSLLPESNPFGWTNYLTEPLAVEGDLFAATGWSATRRVTDVYQRGSGPVPQWVPIGRVKGFSEPQYTALGRSHLATSWDRSFGKVEVFARHLGGPNAYGHLATLTPSDQPQVTPDEFGTSMDIERRTLVVGGPRLNQVTDGGAVYVYRLP